MLKQIDKAIDEQNEEYLQRCIADLFNQTKEITKDFYPRIEKLLVDKWHHEHEDIVGMIWLKDLKVEVLNDCSLQPLPAKIKEKFSFDKEK